MATTALRELGQRAAVGRRQDVIFEIDADPRTRTHEPTAPPRTRSAPRRRPAGSPAPERVDMAEPPPPPRPLTLASTPQQVTLDLERSVLMVIDMQNDFCARGRLGRPPRRRLRARPRADRAAAAPAAAPGARPAAGWSGSTGATGPTSPTCRPTSTTCTSRTGQGIGLGEPLPGHGARVLEKDSWAAAVVDELEIEPQRHPRRQAPHQRLLGYAARLDPAQPRHPHHPLRRRQHRPVRPVHPDRRQLPRLRLRADRGLLRHHVAALLHRGDALERAQVLRLRRRVPSRSDGLATLG